MLRTVRAGLALVLIGFVTLVGIPVQAIVRAVVPRLAGVVPVAYHRFLCRMLGLRVTVRGGLPAQAEGGLYPLIVANHLSWLDIVVMGSRGSLRFIARADMANWPVVGTLTKLQNTVLVDRSRRSKTKETIAQMRAALEVAPLVLFAEGTTSDGNRLLPLKPALLGAVVPSQAMDDALSPFQVVPAIISYRRLGGLPVGQRERAKVAWYGDMELASHALELLKTGAIDAEVTFLDPIVVTAQHNRKVLLSDIEHQMRAAYHGKQSD